MSATLVLGATGVSGVAFVQESLAKNPSAPLVLFARSPSKLPQEFQHQDNIKIISGELSDDAALDKAMKGTSSVVSLLGAPMSFSNIFWRDRSTPIADSLPHVFKAMRANNVKRIVALSTPASWVLPEDQYSWKWWLSCTFPDLIVPQGAAEMEKIAQQVSAQDDLDWTVFRIMFLNNGSADKPVRAQRTLTPTFAGGVNISRPSIARWVLGEIEKPQWIHQAPVLGN